MFTNGFDMIQNVSHITVKGGGDCPEFAAAGILNGKLVKLKSSLRKFYGRYHDIIDLYGISVSQMTTDMFHLS